MDFYKEWLGIPEGPRPPDHYELLRVKRFEDDIDKIRAHYKKLNSHVRKYATGQYSVESQHLLNEIAKAMLCLTDPERKREYDESLGREFEPERDQFGRMPLLDVLVQHGDISRDQKKEVEEFSDRRGLSIRDASVQMKLVAPDVAARALARQLGFSFVDLEDMVPEDDALDLVPRSLVKKHSFVPLFVDDDRLMIACADEIEHELEDELRLRYGFPVRPVLATPRAINQAIAQYYAPGMRDEAKISGNQPKPTASGKAAKAAGPKAAAAAKDPGELNKPLLIVIAIVLSIPVLLRFATFLSTSANFKFMQLSQTIPFLSEMTIAVPLLGGIATFLYVRFKLQKQK
ncbi:MAG: general secretion pathway protein GspE [Planctomycetaceae bacterium]|nr:general secretion pathway protein GspE [Planctomycetaceae bacterium]